VLIYGENEIKVFPTIVENSFTMEAGAAFGKSAFYEIFDISGKKVQNGQLNENDDSVKINTSNWKNGHYFIQITQRGERNTQRLIK